MAGGSTGSLRAYLLTRVLLFVPQVLVILTIVFVLMRVAPGDPVRGSVSTSDRSA